MLRSCFFILTMMVSSALNAQCLKMPVELGRFNLPTVQVEIQGEKKTFCFDLGMAQALSVEEALFNKMAGSQEVKTIDQLDVSGKVNHVRLLENQTLSLSGHDFSSVNVVEYQPWGLELNLQAPSNPVQNTIGLGLFNQPGVLVYSQTNRYVEWCEHPEPNLNTESVQWFPLHIDNEGAHFKFTTAEGNFDMILDSGATVSFIKPRQEWTANACENHPDHQCVNLTGVGEVYLHDFPSEFNSDGLLGGDFFEEHDVIIDKVNQKLGLKKLNV